MKGKEIDARRVNWNELGGPLWSIIYISVYYTCFMIRIVSTQLYTHIAHICAETETVTMAPVFSLA